VFDPVRSNECERGPILKLLIHAGTEKTGSSHIQTICVNGRGQLEASGVYLPTGVPRHESRMAAGLVSAGNAFPLVASVHHSDWASVQGQLAGHIEGARDRHCETVLLTSELFLPYFRANDAWLNLLKVARGVGFSVTEILVVLRRPTEQLVSLYKHRAKSGTAGTVKVWCQNGYELPADLGRLRRQAESAEVPITGRQYTREQGGLERIFFKDFLRISIPQVDIPGSVNPSLSLSELALIRQMAELRPELVPNLYEVLLQVPAKDKAADRVQENFAAAVAAQAVAAHADEWAAWNALLPDGEELEIPETPAQISEPPTELEFSEAQLEAISHLLARAATPGFIAETFWRSLLRPGLGRLARGVGLRR